MAERTVYIYGLRSSRDDSVRYVGKTVNPKSRLSQHRGHAKGGGALTKWLEALAASGHMVSMIILETTTESRWEEAERAWIEKLRPSGLLNISDGGAPGPSSSPSPETLRRRSVSLRASWARPETRQRRLAAQAAGIANRSPESLEKARRHAEYINTKISPETRKRVGAINRALLAGGHLSDGHKQKIADGLARSYREGRRTSRRGTTRSQEEKQKISEGLRRAYQEGRHRRRRKAK